LPAGFRKRYPMPKQPRLAPPESEGSYEVGYRKPPLANRFAKGKSGNPRGRPRGAKKSPPALNEERLKDIIVAEAYRTIRLTANGRPVTISIAEAVVRSIALAAAKGHQRSQRLFTDMLSSTERANKAHYDEWLETAIEYKLDWERELDRRARLGIVAPAPLPHPDDIIIDMKTGRVKVVGPFTKEEKRTWDKLRARKTECDEIIAEHEQTLRDEPTCEYARFLRDEIRHERHLRQIIGKVIKD
jgi:hypothetical protein